jgi:hypothetical protein
MLGLSYIHLYLSCEYTVTGTYVILPGSGVTNNISSFYPRLYNPDHIVNHIHSSGKGTYCPEDVRMFFQFYDTTIVGSASNPVISFRTNRAHWLPTAWVYRRSTVYRLLETWFSPSAYCLWICESYGTFEWVYLCTYAPTCRVSTVTFVSPYPFRTHVSVAMISSLTYSLEEAKSTGDKISARIIPACTRYNIIYRFPHRASA